MRVAAARARQQGEIGSQLAFRLERICNAELLLAPAVAFFEHVLGCDGQTLANIAAGVHQHWGDRLHETINVAAIEELKPELRAGADRDSGRRWVQLALAFTKARYDDAIQLVLEQNAAVMAARASVSQWAVVQEGRLHVRFRDEQLSALPQADELAEFWRHAYFIESLRDVAVALRGLQ
jgi:hypothetical protein